MVGLFGDRRKILREINVYGSPVRLEGSFGTVVYSSRSWNRFDLKHTRQAHKKVVLCCVCKCDGLGGSWVTLGSSVIGVIDDNAMVFLPASATSSLRNGERLLLLDRASGVIPVASFLSGFCISSWSHKSISFFQPIK